MKTGFINKLKNYSYKKQFFILFFIATIDVWVMPILTIIIYSTGLDNISFFQAEYKEFLWNTTMIKPFNPKLITHFGYYYIYIYLLFGELDSLYIQGLGKPVCYINIFHIVSFYLFLIILLFKKEMSKVKKLLIGLLGAFIYYFFGFISFFIGLMSMVIA